MNVLCLLKKTNFLFITITLLTVITHKAFGDVATYDCSLKATDSSERRIYIDIKSQIVFLGQSEDRYDLQPVFVGDHIMDAFDAPYRFMASRYFDPELGSEIFMIGLYRMVIDFDTPGNEHFWRPGKDDKYKKWVAVPMYEAENFKDNEASVMVKDTKISAANTSIRNLEFKCAEI